MIRNAKYHMETEREEIAREDGRNTSNGSEASPVVNATDGTRPPENPPDKTKVNWSSQLF